MKTSLNQNDKVKFLKYIYFGDSEDKISSSISRAYLDFNRTLHKFSKEVDNKKIIDNAKSLLKSEILIATNGRITNQAQFDKWHKDCCDKLISTFGNFLFYYGQAQKWINMTFKYMMILDDERIKSIYKYLHIPIDNIMIENLKEFGIPQLNCSWSRIDDYNIYIGFQTWFRNKFEGYPLDNEFKIWLGDAANLKIRDNNLENGI